MSFAFPLKKFMHKISSLVISGLVIAGAFCVPAFASTTYHQFTVPSQTSEMTFSQVKAAQNKLRVDTFTIRYLEDGYYCTSQRLVGFNSKIYSTNNVEVYKKILLRVPLLSNTAISTYYVLNVYSSNGDSSLATMTKNYNVELYARSGDDYQSYPDTIDLSPDGYSDNIYSWTYFSSFGFNCCLVCLGDFPTQYKVIDFDSEGDSSNVDSYIEDSGTDLDGYEVIDGTSDSDDDYSPTYAYTDTEGNTYYGYKDSNDPNYTYTDSDGNTHYGYNNPNYKWTDAHGNTYAGVDEDYSGDFGDVHSWVYELSSYDSVLSTHYDELSSVVEVGKLQVASVFDNIPFVIIVAIIGICIAIVCCKFLQR